MCGSVRIDRLPYRPADIDADQLALVGRGAAHVGDAFGFVGGRITGAGQRLVVDGRADERLLRGLQAGRLLGRGADHHARRLHGRALGLERDGDAERRPIVGRARRALEIDGAPSLLRRDIRESDELVAGEHGFVVADEETLQIDFPGAGATGNRQPGTQRRQHRRQVHVRIAMGEIAADGGDIAHPDVGKAAHGARNDGSDFRHLGRALDHCERRHGADRDVAVGADRDARERIAELAQADQSRRPEYARLHHQHQRGAAGNRAHGRVVGIEQCDRLVQGRRLQEFKGDHVVPTVLFVSDLYV